MSPGRAAGAALLFVACSPAVDPTQIRCEPGVAGRGCPRGYVCVGGWCSAAGGGDDPATGDITIPPRCGDGVLDQDEGCDDGGTTAGDGCDSACRPEYRWACVGSPSSCVRLGEWKQVNSPTIVDLHAVWGSTGGTKAEVWAVGDGATIAYWDGTNWLLQAAPAAIGQIPLRGVTGLSATSVWAVGYGGTVLHFDGETWASADSNEVMDLHDVWGLADGSIWSVAFHAIGGYATILRGGSGGWARENTAGLDVDLWGVFGAASDDVWAVGYHGAVVHRDASAWSEVDTGTPVRYWRDGHACTPGGPVWIVGDSHAILTRSGGVWSEQVFGPNALAVLEAISGIDGACRELRAVGTGGTVLRPWNGSWVAEPSETSARLYGVWGAIDAGRDAWAVGEGGVILRYAPTPE